MRLRSEGEPVSDKDDDEREHDGRATSINRSILPDERIIHLEAID
jgi:hypothetical protein